VGVFLKKKVWQISAREINKILSIEMNVLRRSTRKSRIERIKNEHIKEIMGVKEKPDIIDIIERMYGAEVWQIPTREINKILSTEMNVLRRSARKSRIQKIKNEHIKEIMGVKEKPDIVDIIERKRLQWYGHVKRMQEERLPKLIVEWIPGERRKRGRPRKTWMEGVRATMKTKDIYKQISG